MGNVRLWRAIMDEEGLINLYFYANGEDYENHKQMGILRYYPHEWLGVISDFVKALADHLEDKQ